MGILPEHVPLLTTLNTGIMSYVNGNRKTQAIAVHWGYAQVDGNNVRVLAELAETAHEIDLPRAQKAEKNAKELLQSEKPTSSDWEDEESRQKVYENKLQRSVVRQAVAKFQKNFKFQMSYRRQFFPQKLSLTGLSKKSILQATAP